MGVRRKTHCKNGHPRISENLFANNSCKACSKIATKQWQAAHPDKVKSYQIKRNEERNRNPQRRKDYWLQTKYGITQERHEQMYREQEGKCAICQRLMDKPKVDHNHDTGEVRQLLCNECNCGIGFFRDDEILVTAALEYLKKWRIPDV